MSLRKISTADELAEDLELQDIRYQELSARRTGKPAPEKPVNIELPMNLQVVWNDDRQSFAAVFKTEIKLPQAEFTIAVSVHVAMTEPSEIADDVMEIFLGDTAFNLAYPYIRTAASSLSTQLRINPVIMLPLIKADVGPKVTSLGNPDQPEAESEN